MVTSDYHAITFNTHMIIQIANAAYTNQPGTFHPQQAMAQVQNGYGVTDPQQAYAEGMTAIPNQPNPFPMAHATFSPDVPVATVDAAVREKH